MARYTAEQIYGFARAAGFSPDQAATMTAIALAESGGNSTAHNPNGEDSRGLWQVNVRSHAALGQGDLYDPLENAKAAFAVSQGGTDISPWTTTHGGLSARYLRYKTDAEAAAVAYGDGPGHGMWSGTTGYGDHVGAGSSAGAGPEPPPVVNTGGSAAGGSGSDATVVSSAASATPVVGDPGSARPGAEYGIPLDSPGDGNTVTAATTTGGDHRPGAEYGIPLDTHGSTATPTTPTEPAAPADTPAVTSTPTPAVTTPGDNSKLHEFLSEAVAQTGDKYVWGAHADFNDPHPSAFDCSDLVQWATHRVGIDLPRTAWEQYEYLHKDGSAISVEQAIHTPGALLFSFSSDPDTGHPTHCHVAISLGDGKTMEAYGTQYGVGSWDANTKRFQYAALIPGLADPATIPAAPTTAPVTQPAATATTTADIVDEFDHRLSTDPSTMDNHAAVLTASEHLISAEPDAQRQFDQTGIDQHEQPAEYPTFDYDSDHNGTDDALAHAVEYADHNVDHHDDGHTDDHQHLDAHDAWELH